MAIVTKNSGFTNIVNNTVWYADRTTTNHITPNLSNLQLADPYNGAKIVQVGNG
jgi:hypothetical protein